MREILFRGKRIDNDEWFFGSLVIDPIGGTTIFACNMNQACVRSETIGQYTGLTLIKRQYLAPLSDSQDENITYWVRYYSENEEKVYVVIKIGLLLYAIIAPISPLDNIVKNIELLYTAAKTTIIEAK